MKIASIDVGLKRIGVAISMDGKIVFPQEAILRQNRKQAARDVKTLLLEWQIEQSHYHGEIAHQLMRFISQKSSFNKLR